MGDDARFWPKAARDQLGRPLLSWDECPTCGEVAARHFYGPTGIMLCPTLKGSEPKPQPPDNERKPIAVPFWSLSGMVTEEEWTQRKRDERATKDNRKGRGMKINPFQKRGYFDGD